MKKHIWSWKTWLVSLLGIIMISGSLLAAGQSSENYAIPRDVISTGGGVRTSANYTIKDTIGQSSTIGMTDSSNYRIFSGFWGPLGEYIPPPVPTVSVIGLLVMLGLITWQVRKRRALNG